MLLVNKGSPAFKDSLVLLQFFREPVIVADLITPQAEMAEMVEMVEMAAADVMALMDGRVISLLSVEE